MAARRTRPELPEVINLPALRAAADTIRRHRRLLDAALHDLGGPVDGVTYAAEAIAHVLTNDYRDDHTRGGS